MVSVTPVTSEDQTTRDRLLSVAREAFPYGQHWFVHLSDHVLAARHDETVVGGVVLNMYEAGNQRVGIIEWIFTDESARGLGAGQRLTEAAIDYLNDRSCDRVLTIVEWHNTSSSKLFAHRDFRPISAWETLLTYGVTQTARIWAYFPIGCHLWERTLSEDDETGASKSTQALVRGRAAMVEAATANALLLLVAVATSVGVSETFAHAGPVALVAVLFLAVRHLPRRALAWIKGDAEWGYRSWGHTYPLALLIALLGGYLPAPGGFEPARQIWTYRDHRQQLGGASLASGMLLLGLLTVVMLELPPVNGLPDPVVSAIGLSAGAYVFVDVLAVFWPFTMYNATTLYRWSRWIWAILALGAAGLFGMWIF